jgi:pimeloyl-ACP methyl ester carboxylesterase
MRKAPVQRQYVDSRFGQSHLYRAGPMQDSGHPPLMCFHMSPWAAIYYQDLLAEMGKDRLAIAVDTPGFGNSDAPPKPPAISDFAAAMGDVVDALGIQTLNVMGDHTGAKVALELARQRPEQVQRVIMLSLAVWTDEEITHRTAEGPHEIHADGSHLVSSWAGMVGLSMAGRSMDTLGNYFYVSQLHHKTAHWGHVAAGGYRAKDALGEVNKPIMILNPEDDLFEITRRAKPYLQHPESHIRDLPGWGYGFLEVKTAEVAAFSRDFLDKSA